jgi:hypothetical protein
MQYKITSAGSKDQLNQVMNFGSDVKETENGYLFEKEFESLEAAQRYLMSRAIIVLNLDQITEAISGIIRDNCIEIDGVWAVVDTLNVSD